MSPFWKPKYETIATIPDEDVLRIMSALDRGWDIMAYVAWEGYLLNGRGVVFADFDQASFAYIPAASPMFRATRDPMWRDLLRTCKFYKPETEIVVVIHHFLHETSSLGLKVPTPDGELPPPRVYEREVEADKMRDALEAALAARREDSQRNV